MVYNNLSNYPTKGKKKKVTKEIYFLKKIIYFFKKRNVPFKFFFFLNPHFLYLGENVCVCNVKKNLKLSLKKKKKILKFVSSG